MTYASTISPTFTLGELAAFIGSMATLITVLWGITMFIFKTWFKRIGASVNSTVLRYIKKNMEALISGRDPESYYTLDVHFTNGIALIAPMIPDVRLMVAENLGITVIHHTCTATTLKLQSAGDAYLPPHWHEHTSELIEVKEGTITHIETGRVYRAGEIWHIPSKEIHSAVFSKDCFALVTHRPPLPTAKERPVDIEKIEQAFLTLPHP